MTAPADSEQVNAGSPETPPAARPVSSGRGRLAAVLRLVLAGSLVAALLGPLQLADWAGQRPLLAQSSTLQTVVEQVDQTHEAVSFLQAYVWLRRTIRALQALRFSADAAGRQ